MSNFWVHRELLYYMESGIEKGDPKHKGSNVDIKSIIDNYAEQHKKWLSKDKETNTGEIRDKELEKQYAKMLKDPKFKISFANMINNKGIHIVSSNILKGINSNANLDDATYNLIKIFNNDIAELSNTHRITREKLKKIEQSLYQIAQTKLPNHGSKDQITAEVEKRQKLIQKQYEQIKLYIDTILKDSDGSKYINIDNDEIRNSLDGLNNIIKELSKISILASSHVQGVVGEMVTAALTYSLATGNAQIEKHFFDDIEKMVAGEGKTYLKRDSKSQIIDNYSVKKGNLLGEIKVDLSGYSENHTNKTDVYIYDYNEEGSLTDKNITNASIKNYSSYNGLTIVDGTPLYDIMSGYGESFIAHYGNLLDRHYTAEQKRIKEPGYQEGLAAINNYRPQMQNIVREAAVRVALMGYSSDKTDMPELFIVFNSNNENDPVRVFRTGPLLTRLCDDMAERLKSEQSKSNGTFSKKSQSLSTRVSYNIPFNMRMPGSKDMPNRYELVKSALQDHKIHLKVSVKSIK